MSAGLLEQLAGLLSSRSQAGICKPLAPMLDSIQAYHEIANALEDRRPFLASRLGFCESSCLGSGSGWRFAGGETMRRLERYSGVFPANKREFRKFARQYLDAFGEVDILGLIGTEAEARLVGAHGQGAKTCELGSLEPYFCQGPWSRHLEGLIVCVVHPFAESIRRQYETVREKLFSRPEVLPLFALQVVMPPQTIAGNTHGFKSWSEALESLKMAVSNLSFDVAILGCGAYGLPLGAFLKSRGSTVIHIGGATQMMFGVSGARWRANPLFENMINEYWKPPLESERPPGWQSIEDGCYW